MGPDNSKLNASKPMPSSRLVAALVAFLQPCYVIQSRINTVLTEAMTKLPASSADASRVELSFAQFRVWDDFGHGRGEAMGMWYPRISRT